MQALKLSDSGTRFVPIPRNNQVILTQIRKQDDITSGSNLITLSSQDEKYQSLLWCEVLAVGPGGITSDGKRIEMDIRPGNLVGLASGGGAPFVVGGKQYIVAEDAAIFVVLDSAEPNGELQ